MRALGPGSVSSFLKVVLDVVYVALMILAAAVLLIDIALLVFQPFVASSHFSIDLGSGKKVTTGLPGRAPQIAVLLVLVGAYFGALLVIVNRLRKVFETLIQGDPFRADNVARLRIIGLGLIALEGLGYVVHAWVGLLAPSQVRHGPSINLTAWFSILVVFVLAEVFREGARLRDEAELTI